MNHRYTTQLADVMRAEEAGLDLQDGPNGIHVFAMDAAGELYELGHVAIGDSKIDMLRRISLIKFHDRSKGTNQ